jgi:alginate O-acetyltransferase complex protein AlgI
MLFTTFTFWTVFGLGIYPLFLIVHRNVPLRNSVLLAVSLALYAMWDLRFLGLLCITILSSYIVGILLPRVTQKKVLLWISILINLSILGFFKYFNFFADSTEQFLRILGLYADWPTLNIVLPIGISFYTFQAIGYIADVYMNKIQPERNLIRYGLFISFFPQVVAGPIERASRLLTQFAVVQPITKEKISTGVYLIVWGLVQKLCIADNAGLIVDALFENTFLIEYSFISGPLAFSLQIYTDFSGYSDIAKGIASLLGFSLVWNFNMPYLASNPSDFWRRWHISLSEWFRDYVYIPLGGNQRGELHTLCNLMITMSLVGLWHGANWTYVLWGVYNGVLLAGYNLAKHKLSFLHIHIHAHIRAIYSWILYFGFTMIGWTLFRSNTLADFWQFFTHIIMSMVTLQISDSFLLWTIVFWMPIVLMWSLQIRSKDLLVISKSPLWCQLVFYYLATMALILLPPTTSTDFIYLRF